MKMDYVVRPRAQHLVDGVLLQPGSSALLRQQRRETFITAAQFVADDVWVFGVLHRRFTGMKQMVGIDAVNDVNMMAAFRQGVRKAVQLDGIATETIRRVEGGQM